MIFIRSKCTVSINILNGWGACVCPSGNGVGAGVLAWPWIWLGTLVGITFGARVPVICPWVGVKLHCGILQHESRGSVTMVHCDGTFGYCGHLEHRHGSNYTQISPACKEYIILIFCWFINISINIFRHL